MASFLVEDGTGLAAANSLCAVGTADAYHTDRGNAGWVGSQAEKEQALRLATEFVVLQMTSRWLGSRKRDVQALPFPMQNLVDRDGYAVPDTSVPQGIQFAVAEYALKVREGVSLMPDRTDATVTRKRRVKIGPIETETDYGSGLVVPSATSFDKAEAFLAPFVSASGELRRA